MAEYMYGIRAEDGMPVSIFDISSDQYGIRCRCVCPDCGKPFEACSLQGKVRRYFRHYTEERKGGGTGNPEGCTAEHANESALHLMAKRIIEHEKKVFGPELAIERSRLRLGLPDNIRNQLPKKWVFRKASVLNCKEVELEKSYPGFRTDAAVTTAYGAYLIEIWHTHKTDKVKLEKVAEYGLPMLEIDISSLVEECPGYETVRKFITEEVGSRKWIFFPGDEERLEKVKEKCNRNPAVLAYRKAQEEAERLEREQREREMREFKQRMQAVEHLFEPGNYRKTVQRLRNDAATAAAGNEFWFCRTTRATPFFTDIPIKGELVFLCDRRIWQGKIFDCWVFNRKVGKKNTFNTFTLWSSLVKEEKIPVNRVLTKKVVLPREEESVYLPYAVIRKYLEYLEHLGFIEIEGKWATCKLIRSIEPPNKEYAALLQKALRKSDAGSLQVDSLIAAELKPYYEAKAEKDRQEREQKREADRLAKIARRKDADRHRQEALIAENSEMPLKFIDLDKIQEADYDQEECLIYDNVKFCRWMKCTACGKAMTGFKISKHLSLNKGVCRSCLPTHHFKGG